MKDSHRFHEIDLLRGLACLSVVLFHYLCQGPRSGWLVGVTFPALDAFARYGYLGVHLFFMISGFVILMSAEGATPRAFVASRVARLYPAYWVAATVTAFALWVANDTRFGVSLSDYLVNLTMFTHWFDVPYVDGAYWSLAVELHFYFYVLIALRLGWLQRLDWLMAGWLTVSALNALRPMWPVEFWLNAKWAPLFVAGGVYFLIRTRGVSSARLALLAASYGLAVIYAIREAEKLSVKFPLAPEIVVAAITGFYLIFALIAFRRWTVRSSVVATWLGVMTYPVYLLHQYLGYALHGYLKVIFGNPVIGLFATFGVVLALAWGVHRWVELQVGPLIKRAIGH